MNALADELSEQDVGSIFLYTHEAHPGEIYPHHTSLEQKLAHARDLRDVLGVTRPILVDALDGACHRMFGAMPNMTWIFNKTGVPLYKSDWTDSHSVANAVQYFLDVIKRRRSRVRLTPFRVERLDYRTNDTEAFFKGLERNGPKAVREFREMFG
ncbi:MAG TPA: hypothetical protein EYP41_16465 [Anaerolineae bacterium]|nr:hypothetical protein [Anaerolineae bacterium]HIP69768.1 hypothetical protein [Anaerolineae bacterium]